MEIKFDQSHASKTLRSLSLEYFFLLVSSETPLDLQHEIPNYFQEFGNLRVDVNG